MTQLNHMPSKQAVFNKVVRHLRRQGRKAANAVDECSYITDDGLRCAVGCFVLPGTYAARIGGGVRTLIAHMEKDKPRSRLLAVLKHHEDLFVDLQYAHDYASNESFLSDVQMRLCIVADRYDLKMPAHEELQRE